MSSLLTAATVSALTQLFAVNLPIGGGSPPPASMQVPQILRSPIAVGDGERFIFRLIEDDGAGNGGAYVIWYDVTYDPFTRSFHLQHLDDRVRPSDPLWPRADLILPETPSPLGLYDAKSDGSGGVFILWSNQGLLFVDHVLPSFVAPRRTGPTVVTRTLSTWGARLLGDGRGGVFVAWVDGREGGAHLYAQHLLGDGGADPGWPEGGLAVCTAAGRRSLEHLASDDQGGLYAVWEDYRESPYESPGEPDVYVHHITARGSVDPAWPQDGLAIAAGPGSQTNSRLLPDGAGGAVIAWESYSNEYAAYALRVMASGTLDPKWPSTGIRLTTTSSIRFVPDGSGGAFLSWSEGGGGVVQRMADLRQPTFDWGPTGVALGRLRFPQELVSDGAGGAFVFSTASVAGEHELFVQHVLSTGRLDHGWPIGGIPVATGPGREMLVQALPTRRGAVLIWENRSDSHIEIHGAALVRSGGPVGPAGRLGSDPLLPGVVHAPEPARQETEITFALSQDGPTSVRILDVTGRRVRGLEEGARTAGAHRVRWDLRDDAGRLVPAGLYLVLVESRGHRQCRRITVIR